MSSRPTATGPGGAGAQRAGALAGTLPFSLGFGVQDGFGLVHTTLVLVSGCFRMLQGTPGSVVNNQDVGTLRGSRTGGLTRRPATGAHVTIHCAKLVHSGFLLSALA